MSLEPAVETYNPKIRSKNRLFRVKANLLKDLHLARLNKALDRRKADLDKDLDFLPLILKTSIIYLYVNNPFSSFFWGLDTESIINDIVDYIVHLSNEEKILLNTDSKDYKNVILDLKRKKSLKADGLSSLQYDVQDIPPLPPVRHAYNDLVFPGVVNGIPEIIGNTPLLRFPTLSQMLRAHIIAKVEFVNPAGTTKDRIAKAIIEKAEKERLLTPGSTIFEGTVGSTGIALATVARAKGYRCHIVMPDDQSKEKYQVLEVLGATVEKVRPCSIVDDNHFVNVARKRANEMNERADKEIERLKTQNKFSRQDYSALVPRGFFVDQFESYTNFETHYNSTALEILEQSGGNIDAVVLGAGTGGTLAGITTRIKRHIPWCLAVLADPSGSGLYNKIKYGVLYSPFEKEGNRRRHQVDTIVEGIGMNRMTKNLEVVVNAVDDCVQIDDIEAREMGEFVLNNDGVWVGSSSCVNIAAACKVAQNIVRERQEIKQSVILGFFAGQISSLAVEAHSYGSLLNTLIKSLGLGYLFTIDQHNSIKSPTRIKADNLNELNGCLSKMKSVISSMSFSIISFGHLGFRKAYNTVLIGARSLWYRGLISTGFIHFASRQLIQVSKNIIDEAVSVGSDGNRFVIKKHVRGNSASGINAPNKNKHVHYDSIDSDNKLTIEENEKLRQNSKSNSNKETADINKDSNDISNLENVEDNYSEFELDGLIGSDEVLSENESDESEWPVVVTVLNDHGSRHLTKFWSKNYKDLMQRF